MENQNSGKINIQGKELELVRLKLKGWTMLEALKSELDTATSKNDYNQLFNVMVKFIEVAVLPTPSGIEWDKLPWYEFLEIYNKVISLNSPTLEFSILRGSGKKEDKKLPWEYEGRAWYFWLNLFAQNYGWSIDTVSELDIDDAIGLYQEIEIGEQTEKEWQWGLSEFSYSYDKSSKKSKHIPMQRPSWMLPMVPKELPVVRMRRDMLPVGNVIDIQAEEMARRENKRGI